MAIDQALLESVAAGRSGPVLRLYRWRPATVTLGYAQRGERVVNLQACRKLGLDVVRRCTGGRAVLHDDEVTYAVVAPTGGGLFPHSVLESYRMIARALCGIYHALGLEARLAPGRQPGVRGGAAEQSACFTAPGQYELVYRGCKLAGCAQKRVPGAFLQHGSLPVNLDLARLYAALDTEGRFSPEAGARVLAGHVGWINRWLDTPVSVSRVEEILLQSFSAVMEADLVPSRLTAAEEDRARQLLADCYARDEWNLKGLVCEPAPER
ncbi:lipoate-protein ligase A [Geothermobacter ehrlichii]|uniref:Lipoate-protein ligase A n=1 Tax=Geothermobacter ehrlichii TaxID=213224 RepID=A0A5D3WQ88_9BACT|nr:biotin/lipoate A/B protein ligase family protein [Geothermobacter ehrlichii]TYO99969.1 lipoate-protein ligase A [Geothermobacter ehrlichii]